MCDCKCQHPEKLKDKPENCTPDQVEECHGKKEEHGCTCGSGEEKINIEKRRFKNAG